MNAPHYPPGTPLWPLSFAELNFADSDAARRLQPSDVASYAYPPGERQRYTEEGWAKACRCGYAILRGFNA